MAADPKAAILFAQRVKGTVQVIASSEIVIDHLFGFRVITIEPFPSSNPNLAPAVGDTGENPHISRNGQLVYARLFGIEIVQRAAASQPDPVFYIFSQSLNMGDLAVLFHRAQIKVSKFSADRVKDDQSIGPCSDPYITLMILKQASDHGQTYISALPVCSENRKTLRPVIKEAKPSFRPDPEATFSVFQQRINNIIADAVFIGGVRCEDPEFVAVIAVQAVPCANPKEPSVIPGNAHHHILG